MLKGRPLIKEHLHIRNTFLQSQKCSLIGGFIVHKMYPDGGDKIGTDVDEKQIIYLHGLTKNKNPGKQLCPKRLLTFVYYFNGFWSDQYNHFLRTTAALQNIFALSGVRIN